MKTAKTLRMVSAVSMLLISRSMAHQDRDSRWANSLGEAGVLLDGTKPSAIPAPSGKHAARLLLEFRYREIRNRVDSLWMDSLRVLPLERPRYRKALETAVKVLTEVKVRLSELKRREMEPDDRKWESLRARAERSIFGLGRFISDAEAMRYPVVEPDPSASPPGDRGLKPGSRLDFPAAGPIGRRHPEK